MSESASIIERLPANMLRRGGVLYLRTRINGRDVWRSLRTGSVKEAKSRAAAVTSKLIDEHHYGLVDKRITLGEWWDAYQASHLLHVSLRRRKRVRIVMNHLLAAISRHRWLHEIERTHASNYLAKRRNAGITDGTVWTERMAIAAVFEAALADGYVKRNVWRLKVGKSPNPRIRLVTPEHEQAIVGHPWPWFRRWWTFVLETGLRLEESLTLDPACDHGHDIRVVGKGQRERYVPFTPAARTAFDEQRADCGLWRYSLVWVEQVTAKFCADAGLPKVSPHDLRHTFATRKALKNMSIYQLSAMLGHSSIAVTQKYYIHIKREDVRRALLATLVEQER